MVERLIKAGHLIRYVREVGHGVEFGSTTDRITTGAIVPLESRPTINYIMGGPFDDQYQSKNQQKKLLRAATVKVRVNAIHTGGSREETKPIDGPISFPSVIVPYYDALILTLFISSFDVHRVLVDYGCMVDLLKLPAFK